MPNYKQWNEAVANYFSAGLPAGTPFYLSVDDNTLDEVGTNYLGIEPGFGCMEDFERAVRDHCIRGVKSRVSLTAIADRSTNVPPNCVAFLGAMVLAAHRMDSDLEAPEHNYFTRLRGVLGLPLDESGRPAGLDLPPPELRLWNNLNEWIRANGWIASAEEGDDIPNRYINYPISQALLRQGDRARLEDIFRSEASATMDWEQIGIWFIRASADLPSAYLRNLAEEAGNAPKERFEAIVNAVYEVYSQVDWGQTPDRASMSVSIRTKRRLTAGLYRESDVIWGTVNYFLYPRKPLRFRAQNLRVRNVNEVGQLREERAGRFLPLPWPVNPSGGKSYPVEGDPDISELILPERDFWILIRDPYDESSGVFASWGRPSLGEPFLLLCKRERRRQLEMLRDDDLLTWQASSELSGIHEEWIEYRECRVLTPNWEGVPRSRQDSLFAELIPRVSASISLLGGLKIAGQRDTWMEGYLPELVVNADSARLVRISNVARPGVAVMSEEVNPSTPIRLPGLDPGEYTVEVFVSNRRADRRRLRLVDWNSLEAAEPPQSFGTRIGDYTLLGGALVKEESN